MHNENKIATFCWAGLACEEPFFRILRGEEKRMRLLDPPFVRISSPVRNADFARQIPGAAPSGVMATLDNVGWMDLLRRCGDFGAQPSAGLIRPRARIPQHFDAPDREIDRKLEELQAVTRHHLGDARR